MKKKLLLFVFSLIFALSFCSSAFAVNSQRVVDSADLMTQEEETQLLSKLNSIYETQQFDVVVVTVTDLEGKSAMAYADDYYDYNGYGYGSNKDGCLLLIKVASPDDREYWISTTGYGITALTDYGIETIGNDIVPHLKDGDYYGAADRFASDVEVYVKEAKNGKPYDVNHKKKNYVKSAGTAFAIAAVIMLIIVLSIKKSYKPVQFNRNASNYLVNGSLAINGSYDNFTYSNVTRTKIEKSSSSGGSSTHSGSSGTSHGGGGGRF